MIGQMLHGAYGVAGFLGQHEALLRLTNLFFNPLSRQSYNRIKTIRKFREIEHERRLHCGMATHSLTTYYGVETE